MTTLSILRASHDLRGDELDFPTLLAPTAKGGEEAIEHSEEKQADACTGKSARRSGNPCFEPKHVAERAMKVPGLIQRRWNNRVSTEKEKSRVMVIWLELNHKAEKTAIWTRRKSFELTSSCSYS